MTIGLLTVEILIPVSASLKEKRVVLNSIKDRLRKKFNVAVAEVGYQDKWQRSLIAIVNVSSKKSFVEEVLGKVFQLLDSNLNFEIIRYNFEYR